MPDQPGHVRVSFSAHLEEIERLVMRQFGMVIEGIAGATTVLLADDAEAAKRLIARDEMIDDLEYQIEQSVEQQLLLESPVARDFRFLMTVSRIVPELERSGDLATHIAERAATGLGGRLTPTVRGQIEQMGAICVRMWQSASDAWAERDPHAAQAIDAMDDGLDALAEALLDELHAGEVALPDAMQTTLLGRFYERLGDHAVHISERVSYLTPGN